MGEPGFEPEFFDIEPASKLYVGNEELRFSRQDRRRAGSGRGRCCHCFHTFQERRPTVETVLSGHKLLRVAELEIGVQDRLVGQIPVAGQEPADLRCDRKIPFTVPSRVKLGLLSEIFDVWHGRVFLWDIVVGGRCPSGSQADAPYSNESEARQV